MYLESDTVKRDCPVQNFRKMMKYKDSIQTVGLPKKKALKMGKKLKKKL